MFNVPRSSRKSSLPALASVSLAAACLFQPGCEEKKPSAKAPLAREVVPSEHVKNAPESTPSAGARSGAQSAPESGVHVARSSYAELEAAGSAVGKVVSAQKLGPREVLLLQASAECTEAEIAQRLEQLVKALSPQAILLLDRGGEGLEARAPVAEAKAIFATDQETLLDPENAGRLVSFNPSEVDQYLSRCSTRIVGAYHSKEEAGLVLAGNAYVMAGFEVAEALRTAPSGTALTVARGERWVSTFAALRDGSARISASIPGFPKMDAANFDESVSPDGKKRLGLSAERESGLVWMESLEAAVKAIDRSPLLDESALLAQGLDRLGTFERVVVVRPLSPRLPHFEAKVVTEPTSIFEKRDISFVVSEVGAASKVKPPRF